MPLRQIAGDAFHLCCRERAVVRPAIVQTHHRGLVLDLYVIRRRGTCFRDDPAHDGNDFGGRVGQNDLAFHGPLGPVQSPDLHLGPQPVDELARGAPGNYCNEAQFSGQLGQERVDTLEGASRSGIVDYLGKRPVEVEEQPAVSGSALEERERIRCHRSQGKGVRPAASLASAP